jgi:Fe-S-cluster containining protein
MKTLSKTVQKEVVNAVREVYAALEKRPVTRNCTRLTECCQFHITGKIPYLTNGEALVAARAYRATGRKALAETEVCPMLDLRSGKCMIYEDRPFGCRTHFCAAAGGPYSRNEVVDLVHKLEAIDEHFFQAGKEASPLPSAVERFL